MITISLCMIVKNEEEIIDRCLTSVADLVDEIIIVDTGSRDNTKKVIEKYNPQIYDFQWTDNFSEARNYAFSKATKEYILWLDADDIILEKDRKKIKVLKEKLDDSIDVVMMKYDLGKDKEASTITFYRERLLKREKEFKWVEPVHEYIDVSGKIVKVDISITHKKNKERSERNLRILENYIDNNSEINPRNYYYYGRELQHLGYYEKAINILEEFLLMDFKHPSFYLDACMDLFKAYKKLDRKKDALRSLYKSFEFDLPRAEICCLLGQYYIQEKDYNKAIFWYEMALRLEKPETMSFCMPDCYDFTPYIYLSLCHMKLEDYEKASNYNELASGVKPNHPAVKKNNIVLALLKKRPSNE
ncbi:tetratricopeptide repeat-containing glycosyltransferase family 2 protein [Natranaerovirga pectinivora]|uniref:tetratricopeptide repeat-containing glycosyltransferase family 2 protein n=1 Tax=Natranaerovirga pectinivora TaxID=682400 RepID=UPI00104A67E3|nr:glycosyltransferase [Natranaerovirga pectinivora]